MGSKGKNWLIGCGVGCAVLVLAGVAATVGVALWFKDATEGFDTAVESRQALEDHFGSPGEFTPQLDGSVPADRMAAFLAIRDATQPARSEVGAFMNAIPQTEEEEQELEAKSALEKIGFGFKVSGAAFGLIKDLATFVEDRNAALIANDMGLGEYTYIYVLAYHSWLGHPPADGFSSVDDRDRRSSRWPVPRVRRDVIDIHENWLEALRADGTAGLEPRIAILEAEIEALKSDPRHVPWQDGLPAEIAASLEPYRDHLEASYNRFTNEFELGIMVKRGANIEME